MARLRGHDVLVAAPCWDASGSSASVTGVSQTGEVVAESRDWEGWAKDAVRAVDATPALIVFYALHEKFGLASRCRPLRGQPGCEHRAIHPPLRDRGSRLHRLSTGLSRPCRLISSAGSGRIRPDPLGERGAFRRTPLRLADQGATAGGPQLQRTGPASRRSPWPTGWWVGSHRNGTDVSDGREGHAGAGHPGWRGRKRRDRIRCRSPSAGIRLRHRASPDHRGLDRRSQRNTGLRRRSIGCGPVLTRSVPLGDGPRRGGDDPHRTIDRFSEDGISAGARHRLPTPIRTGSVPVRDGARCSRGRLRPPRRAAGDTRFAMHRAPHRRVVDRGPTTPAGRGSMCPRCRSWCSWLGSIIPLAPTPRSALRGRPEAYGPLTVRAESGLSPVRHMYPRSMASPAEPSSMLPVPTR